MWDSFAVLNTRWRFCESTFGWDCAELLQSNRSLDALLTVAAALPFYVWPGGTGVLQLATALVGRLRQPAEAERLRQELAAAQEQLPAPLLSLEQLLAFLASYAQK